MKNLTLYILVFFSLTMVSCGDDNKNDSLIDRYEKDIIGHWVPVDPLSFSDSIIFSINKDKSAVVYHYSSVDVDGHFVVDSLTRYDTYSISDYYDFTGYHPDCYIIRLERKGESTTPARVFIFTPNMPMHIMITVPYGIPFKKVDKLNIRE